MPRFLTGSYRAAAAARPDPATRVDRAYWYTWASVYCCEQFRFSGLLRYDDDGRIKAMPALSALRAAIRTLGPRRKAAAAPRVGAAAAPRRKVPFGFVGTVADGPLFEPYVDLPRRSTRWWAAASRPCAWSSTGAARSPTRRSRTCPRPSARSSATRAACPPTTR